MAFARTSSRPTTRRSTATSRRSRRGSAGTVVKVNVNDNQACRRGRSAGADRSARLPGSGGPRQGGARRRAGQCRPRPTTGVPITEVSTRPASAARPAAWMRREAGVAVAEQPDRSRRARSSSPPRRGSAKRKRQPRRRRTTSSGSKGLVAKEEIPQQQFDAAVVAGRRRRARPPTRRSPKSPRPRPRSRVAEQRASQARGAAQQAQAARAGDAQRRRSSCRSRRPAPPCAEARVQQATGGAGAGGAEPASARRVNAPSAGVVSRKTVESRPGRSRPDSRCWRSCRSTTCGSPPTSRRRS